MPTTNRARCACAIAMWMTHFVFTASARADVGAVVADMPAGTLAYWVMDPGGVHGDDEAKKPAPDRMLLLATLRAAVASGITGSTSQAQWVEGLLAAAMVGEVPHTLAVLDFRAHRDAGAPKAEIDGLQIVLELRTSARHEEYLRTLRAILIDAAHAKGLSDDAAGAQRRLDLPAGRKGVAYRAHSWPAWREVSWCSDDDRFVIALGRGALERWYGGAPTKSGARRWETLRDARDHLAAWDRIEAFLDLDALRERFPEGFDEGRVERMVAALDLQDASALLVRASVVKKKVAPALVAIVWITEVDGEASVYALTESAWPAGMEEGDYPVRGAGYVAIARADWRGVYERAMRIHGATLKARAAERFREKNEAWMGEHAGALWTMTDALGEWIVLTDAPEPVLAIPGFGSVFVSARPGVSATMLEARMAELLGPFSKRVVRTRDGVWSLKVDDAGVVRIPAWAWVRSKRGAMLAGGWGPGVVEHARKTLASPGQNRSSRADHAD